MDNPLIRATAYRRAVGKTSAIKRLGIHPDMEEDQINTLIELRAKDKATTEGGDWKTYVSGQRWYVEDLIRYSELDAVSRLQASYMDAFPDSASEDEMIASLEALM